MAELDETKRAILTALSIMDEPAGCGEIGKKAGLPTPKVVPKMRGLLKDGLVERPVEGKRSREWTAVAPTELAVVGSMAYCLGELREGRWPK